MKFPPERSCFSTTDESGKITGAGKSFCEISGYTAEQLVGSPHNIVRHREMPGGLFHLFWAQLATGKPIATYVLNLAADGASYWTLACVSPVKDGTYLSVHVQVSRQDHHENLRHAYDTARATERKMRAAGMSARDAAAESSSILEGLLVERGYGGFAAMAAVVLPDEVDAWDKLPRPQLPAAFVKDGHDVGRVLGATREIDEELAVLRARLVEYTALARSLSTEAESLRGSVGNLSRTVTAAAAASEEVGGSAPVLARAAAAAAALSDETSAHLQALPALLQATQAELMQLRVVVAMCVLHSAAAESFAVEIAKGEASGDAMGSLELLCAAIERTVAAVEREWNSVGVRVTEAADHIEEAADRLAKFQRMLLDWRNLVVRFRLSGQLSGMLGDIDGQEVRSRARMKSLRDLAAECRDAAKPLDLNRLRQAVSRVSIR